MVHQDDKRSIVNLFADVIGDAVHLFQTEIRLIRAEINEKIGRLANGGTLDWDLSCALSVLQCA